MAAIQERRRIGRNKGMPFTARLIRHPGFKTALPFAVVLALWWIVNRAGIYPQAFFVGPGAVIDKFIELTRKGILPEYLGDSITRLVTGGLAGLMIGIPAGYVIGLNRYIRRACWPVLLFFQSIADIAWLPLLIIWFGFSLISVTFVIVYTVTFPIIVGIVSGVDGINEDLIRAARCLGASRRQVLFEVIIPGSLAATTSGIRVGFGYGWRALIAAEIIVGTSGIGFMMFDARRAGQVTEVFMGMIILGILWYAFDFLILAPLERETVERWGIVRQAGRNG
jgi:NitT/TauT family transport system permease protein/taurine transport system permease protein